MGVRIIHAADLHLDSAFEGLTPEKAAERRAGQFDILEEIVSAAETHRVQAVLLCGDIFDRPIVSAETAARVSKILSQTEIPVFIAPGNHDYYFSRSPYSVTAWPRNVRIFRSPAIERIELENLTVYGAGFSEAGVFKSLLSGFRADSRNAHTSQVPATEGLRRKPSVFALHGELNPAEPRYNPILPSDIAFSGLDYLALGHIHLRTEPQKAGNTVFAYCGCPEGRGFDELGQKGVYLVDLDGPVAVRFLPLRGMRYETLSVDLTGSVDPAEKILSALPTDAKRVIYKMILEGEFRSESLSLSDLAVQIAPSVYHAVLVDKTSLPRMIWEQSGDDTLAGVFLSFLRGGLDAPDCGNEKKTIIELAARYGIAALNGEEAPKL